MARISTFQAVLFCISTGLKSTKRERAIVRRDAAGACSEQLGIPTPSIEAAPETQPYRDKSAIGRLLDSLTMRIEDWQASSSCYLVRVSRCKKRSLLLPSRRSCDLMISDANFVLALNTHDANQRTFDGRDTSCAKSEDRAIVVSRDVG